MARIAIIGTGIAGLGCAHFLHRRHDLTLFERNRRVGGHTHTVEINEPESVHGPARIRPVDTGFMVYNEVTYPLLTRLFRELAVPTKPTSFETKPMPKRPMFSPRASFPPLPTSAIRW